MGVSKRVSWNIVQEEPFCSQDEAARKSEGGLGHPEAVDDSSSGE